MFNFPKCRHCNATLPIATGICPHCTQLSPAPAQQSPSESIAAPAEVGQGLGTSHDLHDREDGLAHCKVCGGAEGSLPTECPGARMSEVEEGAVYAGLFDFRNGYWQLQKQEPKLPVEVPESDTLWQLLTGCSLNHVRLCLMCGDPELEQDADRVRQAAQDAWAQIRAEVGA